jgi:clan AA aspartic protease
MITGIVNPDREAVISLKVHGPSGTEQDLDAVIDTGFNSSLTLPPDVIAALGLPWMTQGRVELGNGQEEQFDVYAATVIWDGQSRRILVDAADTMPLVGMSLMYGYDLFIEILDGGSVTLQVR